MDLWLRGSLSVCLLAMLAGPAVADSSTGTIVPIVEPDVTDSSRVIPLEGALNVRDLGGIEGDHGAIPNDRFIRAANLATLTQTDRDILYKHNVVLDIDLRTDGEDRGAPDALAGDRHIRYLPISMFGNGPMTAPKTSSLRDMYLDALASDQPQFKQVFEAIAGAGDGGVLYHCTAGKDRTGMISAMLLELAGVPRERIVHNYAVSAYYLRPMMTGALGEAMKKQPALAALMGSPPDAIEGFLDTLDTRHGGAAAYLQMIGVSADDIAKIRARLTD